MQVAEHSCYCLISLHSVVCPVISSDTAYIQQRVRLQRGLKELVDTSTVLTSMLISINSDCSHCTMHCCRVCSAELQYDIHLL
jgi:hypothetical protein